MSKIENIVNFKKNNDRLSTSGQPTEREIKLIANEEFEIVINARPQTEMNELFDERKIVEDLGMKYFLIETELSEPNMEELEVFLDLMEKHSTQKIFFHCRANKRASGLLAVYRVLKLGWKEEEAIEKVKEVCELTTNLQNFIEVQIDYMTES